jgi:hypothetical protein
MARSGIPQRQSDHSRRPNAKARPYARLVCGEATVSITRRRMRAHAGDIRDGLLSMSDIIISYFEACKSSYKIFCR